MFKQYRRLWIGLGVLVLLTPLGLLASGTAFGEWGRKELKDKLGFVPQGLDKLADTWKHAPLPGYGLSNGGGAVHSVAGYVFSAIIGIILVIAVVMLLSKMVKE
ncbi:MAG: PDGLE domain-containing protein [Candidatus Saccharibacteria bacterium]